MINLVNTSLYSYNKTYDYQSVCDPEKDGKTAAGPRSVFVVRARLTVSSGPHCGERPQLFSALFSVPLSFCSLPSQTCSALAGGHRVLPGEGAVSGLCLYMCVLEWEDFFFQLK